MLCMFYITFVKKIIATELNIKRAYLQNCVYMTIFFH